MSVQKNLNKLKSDLSQLNTEIVIALIEELTDNDDRLLESNKILDQKINNLESQVDIKIDNLLNKIMYNREQIAKLIENMDRKFQILENKLVNLNTTLGNIYNVNKVGFNQSIETQKDISKNIEISTQKNEEGLKKVSSGVATVEILQSKAVSNESKTAIIRSIDEVEERFNQAKYAVEEKKSLFDKHFNETMKGLTQELDLISQHIRELEHHNFENLNELISDLKVDRDEFKISKRVQIDRLNNRANTFNSLTERIENQLSSLKRFQELREKLEYFINTDDSYFKYETTANSGDIVAGYSFPIHVTAIENGGYEMFGFDGLARNLQTTLEYNEASNEAFNEVKYNLSNVKFDSEEMSKDSPIYSELLLGLNNLKNAGIISDEIFELIQQHLEAYSLKIINY
jgi:hypothetical protein